MGKGKATAFSPCKRHRKHMNQGWEEVTGPCSALEAIIQRPKCYPLSKPGPREDCTRRYRGLCGTGAGLNLRGIGSVRAKSGLKIQTYILGIALVQWESRLSAIFLIMCNHYFTRTEQHTYFPAAIWANVHSTVIWVFNHVFYTWETCALPYSHKMSLCISKRLCILAWSLICNWIVSIKITQQGPRLKWGFSMMGVGLSHRLFSGYWMRGLWILCLKAA